MCVYLEVETAAAAAGVAFLPDDATSGESAVPCPPSTAQAAQAVELAAREAELVAQMAWAALQAAEQKAQAAVQKAAEVARQERMAAGVLEQPAVLCPPSTAQAVAEEAQAEEARLDRGSVAEGGRVARHAGSGRAAGPQEEPDVDVRRLQPEEHVLRAAGLQRR